MPRLEVHQLRQEDVYKDIIRVNEVHRINKREETIKEGRVCLVRANGRKCFAILRGYQDSVSPQIRIDDYIRGKEKLDLQLGKSYEFAFEEVSSIGRLRWAWNATEMGYQIASRIALVSFIMGIIGLLFGITGLINWRCYSLPWRWVCFL